MGGEMAGKGERLTVNQRRFVEEYVADGNAVQAYFRAFGRRTSKGKRRSYKAAQGSSSILLSNPIIAAEVEAAQAVYAARVRVSKLRVIRELAALAFSDPADLWVEGKSGDPSPRRWNDVPTATRRAVQSVKVKRRRRLVGDVEWEIEEVEYKLTPKGPELDKLCKKLGFYADDKAGGAAVGKVVELPAKEPLPDDVDHGL